MYNQWTPVRPIFLQGETILVSPVLLNKTTITDCQTKEDFAAIGISMLDLLMGFLLANRTLWTGSHIDVLLIWSWELGEIGQNMENPALYLLIMNMVNF